MAKKYEPNEEHRRLIEQMTAVGVVQEQVAAVLGVSIDTIQRHYKEELLTAVSKANAKIAGTLYNKAMRGDTVCMIFWLKTRAGWRERTALEVTGKDGAAITPVLQINWTNGDGKG